MHHGDRGIDGLRYPAGQSLIAVLTDRSSCGLDRAQALKEQGNVAFKAGELKGALREYACAWLALPEADSTAESVALRVTLAASNSAQCCIKMECFAAACRHASGALVLDPKAKRALFRRVVASEGLGDLGAANLDCLHLLKLDERLGY